MNNIKIPIRLMINEYLCINLIVENNDVYIDKTNCPEEALSFVKEDGKVIVKCCNKEVAIINLSNGEALLTNVYITTTEARNFAEDVRARGYNTAFRSNREMFEEKDPEVEEYPIELHTHFMEVLSGIEFLYFMGSYIDAIPVNSSNKIVDCPLDRNNPTKLDESKVYKWISIEEALKDPAIIEQLRIPADRQVEFRVLSEGLANRNSLIDLAGYYASKERIEEEAMGKDITKAEADDIKSKSKGIILAQMLLTSIESLKDQGIKYVEFSYSNHNTLKFMLSVLEATEIEGITVRFLLSENRTAKPKLHRRNSREVKALMEEYPEVVGFDLMGLEQEIMPSEYENTGECKTLYDRLRFTIEQLLESSREKPTLRLHSGEIYYNREGSPNNNPQFILEILKQIEEDLGVSLADKLNIRIGHGLHFQSTPAYFDLLKHFDVIVEICASSNFALGNVMDLKDMPYKEYEEHGIPFVIGTDGGGFYLTTLKDEAKIAGVFGGDDIIARLKTPPKGVKTTPSTEPTIERDDIPTIKELYEGFLHKNATSYFVKEYNKASNKKKYIKQYFKSEYTLDIEEKNLFPQDIGEYEKVKMEFTRLQAFYHDKVINEVYFSKEQEIIILSTFDKIEKDIKKHKILDAASSIFALQESIKCESRIEKIALYIYSQGKDLTDYLAMPQNLKQVQKKAKKAKNYVYDGNKYNDYDDDYGEFVIGYEKTKPSESFHDINYYVDDILRKKSEIRDKMLENPDEFYKDYFKEGQYHLDIPERGYFNIDESEPSKLLNEMLRTVKFCDSKLKSEAYNETQEAIISDTFNNINRLLEERNYLEAASYLVSLQTVLGMKVKLETAYVYMAYNHKEIEDYINIELFQEKTKGRGKTK